MDDDDLHSDNSDDWGAADLDLSAAQATKNSAASESSKIEGGEDYWKVEKPPQEQEKPAEKPSLDPGEPMILIDLTKLSQDTIHSRFDRNSVNDPEAVSAWRKKITFEEYSKKTDLIADGTVIPCGTSVWRDALVRLRDERAGHYFVPIFP